jgi:hypothetical protein
VTQRISDSEFEARMTALVSEKLASVLTRHAPEDGAGSMVRAIIVGCTYEVPAATGTGGLWWAIGTNRFEQIGLTQHILAALHEPTRGEDAED